MGISFGDILGAGIIGAAGGAGQAIYTDAEQQQQQAMLALRDQRLSDLRVKEHAANVQTDLAALPQKLQMQSDAAVAQEQALAPIKAQEAQTTSDIETNAQRNRPYTMAPGSTRVTPGAMPSTAGYDDQGDALDSSGNVINPESATPTTTYTAPSRLTPEQQEEYQARTGYYKALTDSINAGYGRNGAGAHPKVTLLDRDQGIVKDENTGAIGVIQPGKPAQQASSSHLFGLIGKDQPAQPATPQSIQWFDNTGKPLPNGLADLYPKRGGVISGAMGNDAGSASGTASTSPGSHASSPSLPSGVARPMTKADYDALPKGTAYINPSDGRLYTKN